MQFIPYTPCYPLSQFIDCLWHVSGRTHYVREKVLPTERMNLIINFGSPHKVVDKDDFNRFDLFKKGWITGLKSEYTIIEAVAETNVIGVRFKPGGAYPFLNFPISELSNQIIEMDLIWGCFIEEVRERLAEVAALSDKFRRFEEILLTRLNKNIEGLEAVSFAVGKIANTEHFSSVRVLSEQMGLSQKHLIAQLNKMVGISPKLLARIFRFHQALNSIDPTQPINWTVIAHHCGYYDQAHFNKDFSAFSGLTPSSYLDLRDRFFGQLKQGEDVDFVPIE